MPLALGIGISPVMGGGVRATPASVFGSALKVWFDVQDISTMWQDTTATTPAAVGSGVAKQFCKANPTFYRQQATGAAQPILRQNGTTGAYYLECDGSDDGMATPSLDLSATDKIAVFTAVRKLSDAATGTVIEASSVWTANAGAFGLFAPVSGGNQGFRSGGSTAGGTATSAGPASPATTVLTGLGDISGDRAILRLNGAQVAQGTGDQGTGNYGNYPLYYFRRGGSTLPFNGHEYGGFLTTGTPTADQIAWSENYFNTLSGAY